jgi:hypothetical protein
MRPSWIIPIVLLGPSACMIGPTTSKFAPATRPEGIAADLRFEEAPQRLQGEVLEVQDTAIVLLSAQRLVLVPIRVITAGRFARRGTVIVQGRASRRALVSLRRVSRFPAGMTPEIRGRLLTAYGQTAPDAP